MTKPVEVLAEQALLANAALETLEVLNRHKTNCRQCKASPEFCSTRTEYEANFRRDFGAWERLHHNR